MVKNLFTIGTSVLFVMCIEAHYGQAQGLQYDSAFTLGTTSSSNANIWTVPSGKTWKIISAGGNTGNSGESFYIDGNNAGRTMRSHGRTDGDLRFYSFYFPIWLTEGQTFGISGSSGQYRWISVIQFK